MDRGLVVLKDKSISGNPNKTTRSITCGTLHVTTLLNIVIIVVFSTQREIHMNGSTGDDNVVDGAADRDQISGDQP